MQQSVRPLNRGNVHCNQVPHLLYVVLREQLRAHQVSSSNGRHPFDLETFVPTLHKYLNVVIEGMARYRHQLQDPHPNPDLATIKCQSQR